MSDYPPSKQFVVLVYKPNEPAYVAGDFDTDALANQFIGKRNLGDVTTLIVNKADYPQKDV